MSNTSMIIGAALLAPLMVGIIHSEDSHRFHLGYRMWKWGIADYDPEYLRFLIGDIELRNFLKGKNLEELKRYVPDLRRSQNANEYQRYYLDSIEHDDYWWIGKSAWTVEFRDGKVVELHLWKG